MFAIGLVLGGLTGLWLGHGFSGVLGGALLGGVLGVALGVLQRRDAAPPGSPSSDSRVAMLERRIEYLETAVARLIRAQAGTVEAQEVARPALSAQPAPPPTSADAPAAPDEQAAGSPEASTAPPPPAYGARSSAAPRAQSAARVELAQADRPPAAASPPAIAATDATALDARIRRWLTEGNLLARLGVVVLFFGVAFLLRYFAEHFTVPIEMRLAGVAAAGVALILLGMRLMQRRPAFGLSVQGAGCGVLYLTTFAAFRLYAVLPPQIALALLVAIAALTVWLALRNDSQPLAALALAGGFLAPVLVGGGGSPLPLFAWFALLNAGIVALAWRHSWRALNIVGFVFTFVLGLAWGYRFYRPEHFAVVEPFLALFFALYVALAVLHARQQAPSITAPVDALLVFGVPLVGFALQFGLVRDMRYGAAWSALAVAAVYGVLFAALRRRNEAGLALLARAFAALSIVFVTVAIPNAVDARWTSAWWALEAAGVYWLGCRQKQPLARAFALVLQIGAALVFLAHPGNAALAPFANATFIGAAMIALAGGVTAWLADRELALAAASHADAPAAPKQAVAAAAESLIAPAALGWAVTWWLLAGARELTRDHGRIELPALVLGWCAALGVAALLLHWPLRWPRLAWAAAPLLPVLLIATLYALHDTHTTLLHAGWLVWPASFAIHACLLRIADDARGAPAATLRPLRADGTHALSALAFVAWLCWEASEWTGRVTPVQSVWIACAAVWPAIAGLWTVQSYAGWPIAPHARAYRAMAGRVIAAGVLAWLVICNLISPGDPAPLPYVPLLDPLDLTSIAALVVLARWSRAAPALPDEARYPVLAGSAFIVLNGAVLRTAHHLFGIDWNLFDLLASRPLQAALTLTWTVTALASMLFATRRALRAWWSAGAVLLAVAVGKLFLLDLAALSGLSRVVAFLGVGALLLVIGYVAPFPPAAGGGGTPDQART